MNKKLISIWILAFCTSVGASVQVAAMQPLEKKVKETDQKDAKNAQNEKHLCIKIIVGMHSGIDMLNLIENLRSNGILILCDSPNRTRDQTYIILPEKKIKDLIETGDEELKEITSKQCKKAFDNLLKQTPYKYNTLTPNNKDIWTLYQGTEKNAGLATLSKRPPPTTLLQKVIIGFIILIVLIGIVLGVKAAVNFVWKRSKKEEKQDNKKQQGSKKKKKKK